MAKRKAAATVPASRKAATRKNAPRRSGDYLPVLKLPLEGKIKRADIRKAVREVFKEKAQARAQASG